MSGMPLWCRSKWRPLGVIVPSSPSSGVVEAPEPPLRAPVGADMKASVEALNGASDKVQHGIRQMLGLA